MHTQIWPNFIDNPHPTGPQSNDECFQCGSKLYSPNDGSQPTECPSCCQLCGEMADAEMGEFWDKSKEESVTAHAQCGIDAGLDLA
jgi:hypothetical protein